MAPATGGERFFLDAAGHHLEAARWPGERGRPTLVLLHEGLGCVAGWRDWPASLARATGLAVLAYSRVGYGASDPVIPPRPLTYMHDEGERVLPAVLAAAQVSEAILVGHSDGGSIAIVHGAAPGRSVRALVSIAGHVFCEDISVTAITAARAAYLHGDLRARLVKLHGDNVEGAFWGWNRAWLDPDFRRWNLSEFLPRITAPVLVVQGDADPYGTLAQVEAIARGVRGPVERVILAGCGHAPHRERPGDLVDAIAAFVTSIGG